MSQGVLLLQTFLSNFMVAGNQNHKKISLYRTLENQEKSLPSRPEVNENNNDQLITKKIKY